MAIPLRRFACFFFFALIGLTITLGLSGCCWSYFGVVYLGHAVKTRPSAAAVVGSYRVRQYGGGSAGAKWPTDLVLSLHEDGSLTCTGDHALFVKDFGVAEPAIDPSHLGTWEFGRGREGFPVEVTLVVGGVPIPSDLLQSGTRFGLGISEAFHSDPDCRDTLEFLQDPPAKNK